MCYNLCQGGKNLDMSDLITNLLDSLKSNLIAYGNTLGLILLVLGAIAFGLSRVGPTEMRAKMISYATGLFIGGTVLLVLLAIIPGLANTLSGKTS